MTMDLELISATENAIDPEALVQSLHGKNGLPEEALRKCQRHRELVTPYLIRSIEEANARVRAGGESETEAPWIAYYLLWEFRAKEALPALLAAIPGNTGYDIFCDAITESLPAVLATLANDNLEAIEAYIANRDNDEFSRSSAARSYLYLVRDGVVTRAEAVERLRRHLRGEFDKTNDDFASFLMGTLCELWPQEALEDIREAYARNVVDDSIISQEYVEAAVAEGEERFQLKQAELEPTHLADTVELLRELDYFKPRPERPAAYPARPPKLDAPRLDSDAAIVVDEELYSANSTTIRNNGPRIGRNDPCTCGSGKKYKKCCMREQPLL